jgi:hypothetical protein
VSKLVGTIVMRVVGFSSFQSDDSLCCNKNVTFYGAENYSRGPQLLGLSIVS